MISHCNLKAFIYKDYLLHTNKKDQPMVEEKEDQIKHFYKAFYNLSQLMVLGMGHGM